MSWEIYSLDQIKSTIPYACVGGPFGSELTTRDYVDNGVPVVRGNNLSTDRRFHDDDFVFVSEEKGKALQSNSARPGDLVFTQRGTLGQVGLIPKEASYERYIVSQSQMKLTVDEKRARPEFVYYYFRQPAMIQLIKQRAITSGVPHINLGILKSLEIRLPGLAEQDRILAILSGIDAGIENNRRRMALLEEAARQLYREWFVRLRFPGHEHTRVTNGVPEGWESMPTPQAIQMNPSTPLSDADEHWWVEMADLPTDSMVIQNAIKRDGRSGSKFRNGDTLFARITPCLENGKTGFVNFMEEDEVGRGSTEFIVLRSEKVTPEFVYCLARTYDFREHAIKSMIGASGRQRVQESCFDKLMILVPPKTLLAMFNDSVVPIFAQIKTLHAQNRRLRIARDLLLPRLMTGEVAI